jgi:hypothetical protein
VQEKKGVTPIDDDEKSSLLDLKNKAFEGLWRTFSQNLTHGWEKIRIRQHVVRQRRFAADGIGAGRIREPDARRALTGSPRQPRGDPCDRMIRRRDPEIWPCERMFPRREHGICRRDHAIPWRDDEISRRGHVIAPRRRVFRPIDEPIAAPHREMAAWDDEIPGRKLDLPGREGELSARAA